MKTLLKKIAALLPGLEARGEVYLYALAERPNVNGWEILLSADWTGENYISAIGVVVDALVPSLDPSEIIKLARVAILSPDDPRVLEMPEGVRTSTPDEPKLLRVPSDEYDTRRMYVFKASPPHGLERLSGAGAVSAAMG